jgi:hypothetical protein
MKAALKRLESELIKKHMRPPPLINANKMIHRPTVLDVMYSRAVASGQPGIQPSGTLALSVNTVFKKFK